MGFYKIFISSERERARYPNQVINPSDFTYRFDTPLFLESQFYEVVPYSIEAWNSVPNMVGQTLDFTVQSTVSSLTIPNGQYSVANLNTLLQAHIAATIPAGVGDIEIRSNDNTNRVEIVINDAGASIDLNGYMAGFFGFSAFGSNTPVSVSGVAVHSGSFIAQVSNGADVYQLRTDLHQGTFADGRASDVLFQFFPAAPPQSSVEIIPPHLIGSPINKSVINSIHIRFTDQTGKLLDFGGEDTSCTLLIRPATSG